MFAVVAGVLAGGAFAWGLLLRVKGPRVPETWSRRGAVVVLAAVLGFWIASASGIGYNSEQVAGYNLYPRQDAVTESVVTGTRQADGLVRQDALPTFGVRVGERHLPLLVNPYISGLTYWPFIALVELTDVQHPQALRWFLWPFLGLLLWAMARFITDGGARAGTQILAPGLFAFFPMSIWYGTAYVFEWMPIVMLFLALFFLGRWNRRGRSVDPIIAAALIGLAIHQKLTYAPIAAVVLICHLLVFGIRRMPRLLVLTCAGLVSLGPLIVLGMILLSGSNLLPKLSGGGGGVGPLMGLVVIARSIFVTSLLPPSGLDIAADITALMSLLAYGGWKIHCLRRGDRSAAVPAFVAGVLWGVIPLFAFIYARNSTSVPSLPLLPFVVILAASALLDVGAWVRRRSVPGVLLLVVLGGSLAVGAGARTGDFIGIKARSPGHFSLTEQRRVTDWLEGHEVRRPLLEATRFYDGVFEFLSGGRVLPRYVTIHVDGRRRAWDAALTGAGAEPVVVLLVREVWPGDDGPESVDDQTLAAAAAATHRKVLRREEIADDIGRTVFSMVWLDAVGSRP